MSGYFRLAGALAHNLARRLAEDLADCAAVCRRGLVYKLRSLRRGYDDTGPPGDPDWNPSARELAAIVESVHQKPWFCELDRRAAHDLVSQGGDGCFLIRPSSSIRSLTLTLWYQHRSYNILIRQREDGLLALGSKKPQEMTFRSVEEMVRYHERETLLLYSGGEPAGRTKLRAPPPGLHPYRSFYSFLSRPSSKQPPEGPRKLSAEALICNTQVPQVPTRLCDLKVEDVQAISTTEYPFINRKLPDLPEQQNNRNSLTIDMTSEYTFL